MIAVAERYSYARDLDGMTIEEWEAAQGLPPFSVAPNARAARNPGEDGWFMYTDRASIIAEEDRQIQCLYALGLTLRDIAGLYSTSFNRIHKRVHRRRAIGQKGDK